MYLVFVPAGQTIKRNTSPKKTLQFEILDIY